MDNNNLFILFVCEIFMTLEDKWKEAEEHLKKFNECMELIKKYPIKLTIEVKSPPYTIEGSIPYQQSFF